MKRTLTTTAAAQETTIREALEKLRLDPEGTRSWNRPHLPAERILRQVDGRGDPAPRTSAELDALADRVAAIAADATLPDDVRWEATLALLGAASADREGTPYPRAFDLLVEVYESGPDGRLFTIMRADSVRGLAYMRELFDRSERPPICRRGWGTPTPGSEGYSFRIDARPKPFCKAGHYLFRGVAEAAWERTPGGKPRYGFGAGMSPPVPEGMPEEVEDWYRRCL